MSPAIKRRRLRWLGAALLLICLLAFVVAHEQNEAYSREVQNRAAIFQGLPDVQTKPEMPLASKVALVVALLSGPAGLGCLLFGLPPKVQFTRR